MNKYLFLALAVPMFALGAEGDSLSFLDSILATLQSFGTGGLVLTIAAVLEFAFRLFKTKEPLSIAWLVSRAIRKVADILGAAAALLDRVLPQNTTMEQ